jgi:hypothetical protein
VSPVELLARQCEITVVEVYAASGNDAVATRAEAQVDGEVIACVHSDRPTDSPERLAVLLATLGMAIGARAQGGG